MKRMNFTKCRQGFTLVEMLIVAPIVILIIGVFIGVIVGLTGDVMLARSSSAMAYSVQDSLNSIKQDVTASSGFLATNNIPVTSPQGYNDDGTLFDNVSDSQTGPALILNIPATTKNPLDSTSSIVYAQNQPNACGPNQNQNTPVIINVVYFVKNSSLWRRVIIPKTTQAAFLSMGCLGGGTIFQRPSCTTSGGALCIAQDQKLVDNIQTGANGFSVSYFPDPTSSTANSVAVDTENSDSIRQTALQTTNTVKVTITSEATIAGRQKIQAGNITAVSSNNDILSQIITTQPVNALETVNDSSVSFSAVSSSSGATIQWQQSTDQASTWTNLSDGGSISGATTGTLTINPAANTKEGYRYRAVFTNGVDVVTTSPARLSFSFTTFNLATNWSDYAGSYSTNGYRKTSSGVVILKGLIKKSEAPTAGETIATLPPEYRPSGSLIFVVSGYNGGSAVARLDINSSGNIIYRSGSTGSWLSLEGMHFIPDDGRYDNSTVAISTFSNGWTNYGSVYTDASYVVDNIGRVHVQGLVSAGTLTDNTLIFNLPSNLLPSYYMHVASLGSGFSAVGINTTSGVVVKPNATSWLALQAMYYPASPNTPVSWTAMSLQNSWVNYNGTNTQAGYTKGADGIVSLRGLVKSGTATDGTIIATLPAGYRPSKTVLATADTNSSVYCRLDVTETGNIIFRTSCNNTWLSMDAINFYAEQ